jgi:hypothetical protein
MSAAQVHLVQQNYHSIVSIKDPSEEVQVAAVSQNGFMIQKISNPTEAAKIAAVRATPKCLQILVNPSDAVFLAAVETDPSILEWVGIPSDKPESISPHSYQWKTPSPELYVSFLKMKVTSYFQNINIEIDCDVVDLINNSEESVKLDLVSKIPSAVQFILEPSEEVQMAAVTGHYSTIRFIDEPCEAAQVEAIKHNKFIISLIKNPTKLVSFLALSDKEQIELVTNDADAIKTMADPCEKAQLLAIAKDASLLLWIKKPAPKALIAAFSADFSLYDKKNVYGKYICSDNDYSKHPYDYEDIEFAAWKKDHENPRLHICIESYDYPSYLMAKYDVDVYLKSLNIETNNLFNFLNSATIDFQLQIVEAVPAALYFIDNPTEEVQLKGIALHNNAICLIKNPTEKVQLHAINNDFRYDEYCVIRYIKNPTQTVLDRLAAIREERRVNQINIIKTLTAQQAAHIVSVRPDLIQHLSEEIKNDLLNHNGDLIQYIEDPTEEQQIQAISQNTRAIQHIKNPTEKVKILAFFS